MSLRTPCKPLAIAVSMLCLSLAACSDKKTPEKNADIDQNLARAQTYQHQGQFRAAIIEAKNALQKAPNNPDALVLVAEIYNELGDSKQALAVLEKVDATSDNKLFVTHLDTLLARGKANSALELVAKQPASLTQEQKENVELDVAKADVLTGNFSKAAETFKRLGSSNTESVRQDASIGLAGIALQANHTDDAIKILDEALSKTPTFTDALVMKASIAYQNKDLDKAEELLSQALLTLPSTDLLTEKRANVLDSLVNVLTRQGRTAEAMIYTKKLAEARPGAENVKQQFEEGVELLKAGKLDEAEQKLLQVYNQNNAPDAAGRLLGIIRMQEGDMQGAEQYFSQHIDPETANPEALRLLAESQLRQNKTAETLKVIEENISKSPDNAELLGVYGLAAIAEGQGQKGVDALEKALKIDPSRTRLRGALAEYYLRTGQIEKSLEQLKEAIQKSPADLGLRGQLIRELSMLKRYDDIKQQAALLEKDFATNADGLAAAGSTYLQLQQTQAAKIALEKALKLDANNISALLGSSVLALQNNDWDGARKFADQVVELDPNNIRAFKLLAGISYKTQSLDAYVNRLTEMSAKLINAWGPEITLSDYYLAKGDTDQALKHCKEALARSGFKGYPRDAASNLYLQIARKELRADRLTEARSALMEGLQASPNNLEMLDMLAHIEIKGEKFTEVDKIVAQIREAHPKSPVPDLIDVDKLIKQGNKSEAITKLQTLWDKSPLDPVAARLSGLLDDIAQDKFFADWVSKLPKSAEGYLLQALKQQSKGDVASAETGYRKVLELAPNEPRALNNLAWILFEKKEIPEATKLAEKAATLAPNDAAVLDTYGWILFNGGDKEKAKSVLKTALDLAPSVAEIKQHYEAATR